MPLPSSSQSDRWINELAQLLLWKPASRGSNQAIRLAHEELEEWALAAFSRDGWAWAQTCAQALHDLHKAPSAPSPLARALRQHNPSARDQILWAIDALDTWMWSWLMEPTLLLEADSTQATRGQQLASICVAFGAGALSAPNKFGGLSGGAPGDAERDACVWARLTRLRHLSQHHQQEALVDHWQQAQERFAQDCLASNPMALSRAQRLTELWSERGLAPDRIGASAWFFLTGQEQPKDLRAKLSSSSGRFRLARILDLSPPKSSCQESDRDSLREAVLFLLEHGAEARYRAQAQHASLVLPAASERGSFFAQICTWNATDPQRLWRASSLALPGLPVDRPNWGEALAAALAHEAWDVALALWSHTHEDSQTPNEDESSNRSLWAWGCAPIRLLLNTQQPAPEEEHVMRIAQWLCAQSGGLWSHSPASSALQQGLFTPGQGEQRGLSTTRTLLVDGLPGAKLKAPTADQVYALCERAELSLFASSDSARGDSANTQSRSVTGSISCARSNSLQTDLEGNTPFSQPKLMPVSPGSETAPTSTASPRSLDAESAKPPVRPPGRRL